MIKAFLGSLEDPERPLFGPNYWFLIKTGLILPKNKLYRFLAIFWLEWVISLIASGICELYVVWGNVDSVLTIVKMTIYSLIMLLKVNIFIFNQEEWKGLIAYITESDRYKRDNQDETRGKIIDKYTKHSRRLTYLYTCLLIATDVTAVVAPLISYFSSKTLRHTANNGTEPFPHIYSSWVPFDKDHSPGNWITVVWHISLAIWGTAIVPAIDSAIFVMMIFFGGKLDLLLERSRQMLGTDGKKISDEEAHRILCELHHTHVMLLKNMKVFDALISPIMFMCVIVLSITLCSNAFQFTMGHTTNVIFAVFCSIMTATTVGEKLLFLLYLICASSQMFMTCWHSSDVIFKQEQLMRGPYESEWWCASARQRRHVLILTGQFSIVHPFTAGPFTNLTLGTFVTLIKGAYSYFTLLRS